jgi:hypothetical protein
MSSKRLGDLEKVRAKKRLLLLKTSVKGYKIKDFFSDQKKSKIKELVASK